MSEAEQEVVEQEVEPVEEVAAEVEQQPFAISQEEWETTQNYLRATAPLLQQVQQLVASGQLTPQQGQQALQQAQVEPEPEFDPFEPESVQRYIEHKVGSLIRETLQQEFEPFQGLLGMVASEKGEALARAEMETLQSELGEFDQDLTYVLAAPIIESGEEPSQAFRRVAQYVSQRDQQIHEQAYAKAKADIEAGIERIAGAPGETTGGALGQEATTVPTGPNRYKEAVARALAARQAARPIG